MRAESCKDCPHFSNGSDCVRLGKSISKIRGCSMSLAGKAFFKARRGDEAFRVKLGQRKAKGKMK